MKTTSFWSVTSCILVWLHHFSIIYSIHLEVIRGGLWSKDSNFAWNIGMFLPHDTAAHPRRWYSSWLNCHLGSFRMFSICFWFHSSQMELTWLNWEGGDCLQWLFINVVISMTYVMLVEHNRVSVCASLFSI